MFVASLQPVNIVSDMDLWLKVELACVPGTPICFAGLKRLAFCGTFNVYEKSFFAIFCKLYRTIDSSNISEGDKIIAMLPRLLMCPEWLSSVSVMTAPV